MGNNHVKAWALVVVGFGYFAVILSVGALIASIFADIDSGLGEMALRLTLMSGFLTGALLILVGSYVLWKVEGSESDVNSTP